MGHTARIVILEVDMLLIRPSWWSRVGVGTSNQTDRSWERHSIGGQAVQGSRPETGDDTNPASQPQAGYLKTYRWFTLSLETEQPSYGLGGTISHGDS